MAAGKSRIFTPARIVTLVLIAVAAVVLGYLRLAGRPAPVTVPAGAKAGDLTLKPGSYATEKGPYKADIGTLIVPENRSDPKSRLIALPIVRVKARSGQPTEPVFRLQGGPGLSNMDFPQASVFAGSRDLVLVGYRGIDGSVRLDAPEVESALRRSADFLGEESFRAYGEGYKAAARRLASQGIDLTGYTMSEQADDLEAARVALGYKKVDLFSDSAGTRLAMICAWRHPSSVHRSVMLDVNPPGHFLFDPRLTDEQIHRYARLYAESPGPHRTDDLAASMRNTARHMPDRWLFLRIKKGNARVVAFQGLTESTPKGSPLAASAVVDTWLTAAEGDASGLWFSSVLADLIFPRIFVWGEYAAIGTADAGAARGYFSSGGDPGSILGDPLTYFSWGGGSLADAWTANRSDAAYSRVQTSTVETLLISGTLDLATPPQPAERELLPHLPNGQQVVLAELGHVGSFWGERPEGASRLINTFYDTGRVDDSAYAPVKVDFKPNISLPRAAKSVLGVMVGLALVAVLSLVWMARRVRTRGRFGSRAGAILRSVYAIVLGLGGWFLGALFVMTALPRVHIDDPLLVTLSMGLPIGAGIWLAWVDPDWPPRAKASGFAASVGGALLGAWLGFQATGGFLALVTAIVGGAAGGNLAVLVLDVVWDGRRDARPVATTGAPTG